MKQRIAVLPHIGTAYGHAIRTGEIVRQRFAEDDVSIVVDDSHLEESRRFFPEDVSFVPREGSFQVTSAGGGIATDDALVMIDEQEAILRRLQPDIIVGDPGLDASVLSHRLKIPWAGIMHGVYLPIPSRLQKGKYAQLAKKVWSVARSGMDPIIQKATDGAYSSWDEIRDTGSILIPNSENAEPCEGAEHLGVMRPSLGREAGTTVQCLVTISSAGTQAPPREQLEALVKRFGTVHIAGLPTAAEQIPGVEYIGDGYQYHSLVGPETTVVTHGGHGTLKDIAAAKRVIVVPGDIDQLANALIAAEYRQYECAISPEWEQRLESDNPFVREVLWEGIDLEKILEQTPPKEMGGELHMQKRLPRRK